MATVGKLATPPPAPLRPWWQQLPARFEADADRTELHVSDPLKVLASVALDHLVRAGLSLVMSAALLPQLTRRQLQQHRRQMAFYGGLAERGDVDAIFPRPARDVPVQVRATRHRIARCLAFDSAFTPLNPELTPHYHRHQRNRRAHAQYWSHPDGPRPTLIFLHSYILDSYLANARWFCLPWLYRHGYDLLLVTLPFHGPRREARHYFSGHGYVAHGLAHLNEAMLHAIHDVRVWMDFLEDRGVPAMGVSGLSLGGYLAALLAAVEQRLAFCIPTAPAVSIIDNCFEWLPLRWLMQAGMQRSGTALEELRQATALHSALSYPARIGGERQLIIAGAGDRFTSPHLVRLLHQHWAGSRLLWFPGNHLLHLRQGHYLREMRALMDRCTATPPR